MGFPLSKASEQTPVAGVRELKGRSIIWAEGLVFGWSVPLCGIASRALYQNPPQISPICLPFFRITSPERQHRSYGYATIAPSRPAKKCRRIFGLICNGIWYYAPVRNARSRRPCVVARHVRPAGTHGPNSALGHREGCVLRCAQHTARSDPAGQHGLATPTSPAGAVISPSRRIPCPERGCTQRQSEDRWGCIARESEEAIHTITPHTTSATTKALPVTSTRSFPVAASCAAAKASLTEAKAFPVSPCPWANSFSSIASRPRGMSALQK